MPLLSEVRCLEKATDAILSLKCIRSLPDTLRQPEREMLKCCILSSARASNRDGFKIRNVARSGTTPAQLQFTVHEEESK